SRNAAGEAPAAARTRRQTSGTTLPTANPSHGGGESEPTMDSTGGALTPLAAGLRLRASESRGGCSAMSEADRYLCPQKMSDGASLREEKECPDCPRTKNRPVQPHSVVDKSDFCPSGLTVPSDTPYDQEALSVSYFKW